ncbi:MAG: hypothetical protein MRY21_00890 [Simkaniaceae bacterium]|nr:hypothetical protein [Simkaniaceae bacterium]
MLKKQFTGKEAKRAITALFTSKIPELWRKKGGWQFVLFHPGFYVALFILCMAGPVGVWCIYSARACDLEFLSEELVSLETLASKMVSENERRAYFREKFGSADPNYLTHQVESLTPLKAEVDLLTRIGKMPSFQGFEPITKRLQFLTLGKNQPLFEEIDRRKSEGFVEVESRFIHPVTVDLNDLSAFLTRVEGSHRYRPQMFFKKFEIKRDTIAKDRESYQLNMEVLTREIR